jgi:hypothetical protein
VRAARACSTHGTEIFLGWVKPESAFAFAVIFIADQPLQRSLVIGLCVCLCCSLSSAMRDSTSKLATPSKRLPPSFSDAPANSFYRLRCMSSSYCVMFSQIAQRLPEQVSLTLHGALQIQMPRIPAI